MEPVNEDALNDYRQHEEEILRKATDKALERTSEVEHHGDEARQKIRSGFSFTSRMLLAAMEAGVLELLTDEADWAMQRLPHDGVVPEYVANRIELLKSVVEETLSAETSRQVTPYIQWLHDQLRARIDPE